MITYADLFDAIEKNGFEQAYGALVRFVRDNEGRESRKIGSACAMGQGMLNLGILPSKVDDYVDRSSDKNDLFNGMYTQIYRMNDNDRYPPQKIAEIMRSQYAYLLNFPLPNIPASYFRKGK